MSSPKELMTSASKITPLKQSVTAGVEHCSICVLVYRFISALLHTLYSDYMTGTERSAHLSIKNVHRDQLSMRRELH